MKNLIIVSTQFQLLNSIELIESHLIEKNFRLIFIYSTKFHEKQILRLAQKYNIKILFKIKQKTIIQYFYFYFKIIRNLYVNTLIIGNTEDNIMKAAIKILVFKNLYFVDDGNILECLNNKPNHLNKYLPVTYFTTFSLKSNNYYKLIENNYTFLKSKNNKVRKDDKVFFIGQPMVESGLLEQEPYIEFISKLSKYFNDNLIYILHPRELNSKFSDSKSIKTMRLKQGVETYFMDRDVLPNKILSFYSTALISLSKIIKSKKLEINYIDLRKHFKTSIKDSSIYGIPYKYLKVNHREFSIKIR
tara:strand:- start:2123 stop:3031 length:909 start_codon:yes stop_codon:yes gene_type:complete